MIKYLYILYIYITIEYNSYICTIYDIRKPRSARRNIHNKCVIIFVKLDIQ